MYVKLFKGKNLPELQAEVNACAAIIENREEHPDNLIGVELTASGDNLFIAAIFDGDAAVETNRAAPP